MSRAKKARRFSLLDGILCAVTALAVTLSVCYFLAADGSAAGEYTVAEDSNAASSLTKAALTGTETELSAAQMNRLLQERLNKTDSGVQQILVGTSGAENEIQFCITVRAKGRSWVLSGEGTLVAEAKDKTVDVFVFSPKKMQIGKLPLSRRLFFSLLQPDQLPDGITVADEKMYFSASLLPVSLASFRVSETAFVFHPKGPLDQLMDKIDDFAQQSPEEQSQSWQELKQELTRQAGQALEEGKDAFEAFRQKIQEQYSSLDTEQIFSEIESGLQSAAGKVESFVQQNGDKISDAVQDLLDALQSGAQSNK